MKHLLNQHVYFVLAFAAVSNLAAAQTGSISLTNTPMQVARSYQTATTLNTGGILIAGGEGVNVLLESFSLSTGSFQSAGSMMVARTHHTATLLSNGTVLITGGIDGNGTTLSSAEIYDPISGTARYTSNGLTPTGMNSARSDHRATLLQNGKVLITGGVDANGVTLNSAEIYNPGTGSFTIAGNMQHSRSLHTATLLNDQQHHVLIAGGANYSAQLACSTVAFTNSCSPVTWTNGEPSAELYNPVTGQFTSTGSMQTGRWNHTATLLSNGQVVILDGGQTSELQVFGPYGYPRGQWVASQTAEVYDPTSGIFLSGGTLNTGRSGHTATLLANGLIFVAGGEDLVPGDAAIAGTEIYNPTTGISIAGPNLSIGRAHHSATLLSNNAVLIAGGTDATAEIYWPNGVAVTIGSQRVESYNLSWGYMWNGYSGGPCNSNWYTQGVTFPNDFYLGELRIPNHNNGYGGGFYIYEDTTSTIYASSTSSNINFGDGVAHFYFAGPLIRVGHTYFFDGDHVGPPGSNFTTGGYMNCSASVWDFYSAPAPAGAQPITVPNVRVMALPGPPGTASVNVRDAQLDSTALFQQDFGAHGTVVGGPIFGTADNFAGNWWQIQWDSAPQDQDNQPFGWTAGSFLEPAEGDVPTQPDFSKSNCNYVTSPKICYYSSSNPFWEDGNAPVSTGSVDQNGNNQLSGALGNCTWYAYGRILELGASPTQMSIFNNDASLWATDAPSPWVDSNPTVHSIAQSDQQDHVAVVESLNDDGTITVTESSYCGPADPHGCNQATSTWNFLWRNRTVYAYNSNKWFSNYIHVPISGAPAIPPTVISFNIAPATAGKFGATIIGKAGSNTLSSVSLLRTADLTGATGWNVVAYGSPTSSFVNIPLYDTPPAGTYLYAAQITDNANQVSPLSSRIQTTMVPLMATLTSPVQNATLASSGQNFTWAPVTGATGYALYLGSTGAGSANIYNSKTITASTVTVNNLPANGETIYAQLWTNSSGVYTHSDSTFVAQGPATLTSPTQGTTFIGNSQSFTWTPVPGATSYALYLGSTGAGSANLFDSRAVTTTTVTANGLPVNGGTVYARLYTNFSGGSAHNDYT
ncbi:MAG: kelch repeat-containing protein, partial [Terracidiphilus sp.]